MGTDVGQKASHLYGSIKTLGLIKTALIMPLLMCDTGPCAAGLLTVLAALSALLDFS